MALLRFRRKRIFGEFIREIVLWEVELSADFPEGIKYRFVLIHKGKRVLGYDNKMGEGHHRHFKDGKYSLELFSEREIFNLLRKFYSESEKIMEGEEID